MGEKYALEKFFSFLIIFRQPLCQKHKERKRNCTFHLQFINQDHRFKANLNLSHLAQKKNLNHQKFLRKTWTWLNLD
jgi:hypothetical protein